MTATRAGWIASGCLALCACDEGEGGPRVAHSFAEAENLRLSIGIEQSAEIVVVRIGVGNGGGPVLLGDAFAVAVDGYVSVPGNADIRTGTFDPEWYLELPTIRMELPPERLVDGAELTVTDGETSVTLPLGDALVPRRLTWLEPADGVVHSEEAIALQWSPATDALTEIRASISSPTRGSFVDVTADPSGQITGTTPALDVADDATASVSWRPPTTTWSCLGGQCSLSRSHHAQLPAVIAAP